MTPELVFALNIVRIFTLKGAAREALIQVLSEEISKSRDIQGYTMRPFKAEFFEKMILYIVPDRFIPAQVNSIVQSPSELLGVYNCQCCIDLLPEVFLDKRKFK